MRGVEINQIINEKCLRPHIEVGPCRDVEQLLPDRYGSCMMYGETLLGHSSFGSCVGFTVGQKWKNVMLTVFT